MRTRCRAPAPALRRAAYTPTLRPRTCDQSLLPPARLHAPNRRAKRARRDGALPTRAPPSTALGLRDRQAPAGGFAAARKASETAAPPARSREAETLA